MSGGLVDAGMGEVSADLIRQLVLGKGLSDPPHRLRLRHARVIGNLDLRAVTLACPLELTECHLEGIDLKQAQAPAIYLTKCQVSEVDATQLRTRNSLSLHGSTIRGRLRLLGARIDGTLDLDNLKIINSDGDALVADGIRVGEDIKCGNGFRAKGKSSMIGAEVEGQFKAAGGHFVNAGRTALCASSLHVKEHLIFGEGFHAEGEVCLNGSHIEGRFDCGSAHFLEPADFSLTAATMKVEQDIRLGKGFVSRGTINLTGVEIGGQLDCSGGRITYSGKIALDLARATIKQNAIFRDGFSAEGQVFLNGANIGGSLWCEGGHFQNHTDGALLANDLKVGGDVELSSRPFGDQNIPKGFVADGEISFVDAEIKGSLNCEGGRFSNSGGSRIAIKLTGCRVTRRLKFNEQSAVEGGIDLRQAEVGELSDSDFGFKWPETVLLHNFVYDSLNQPAQHEKRAVEKRIEWLKLNKGYVPQIYRHLASVYYSEGRDRDAEKVLIAQEKIRRTGWRGKAQGWFFWATVGYGFRPAYIMISLTLLYVAGGIFFSIHRGDLHPVPASGGVTAPYQPWLYTLDLLLPVVNLKQRDHFIPRDVALWMSTGYTIAGWILGTVLLVGIHNMLKRSK